MILQQPAPTRPGAQGLRPHQPLDPVQAAGNALGQHVVSNPPGTIGSVTGKEARPHLRADCLVVPGPLACWPRQPSVEAGP